MAFDVELQRALHTLAETSEIETRAPAPRRRECTRSSGVLSTNGQRTYSELSSCIFESTAHIHTLLQLRKSQF